MTDDKNPFEHILYECEMLLYTGNQLVGQLNNQLDLNMTLDSFAIHLRNLAYFFNEAKISQYWHASDYINDRSKLSLIPSSLYQEIKEYTSRATCHLLDYRLGESYKAQTMQCYNKALPQLRNCIMQFISTLDIDCKQEYRSYWQVQKIQKVSFFIKGL